MTKKQGACGIVCEWNPLHAGHIRLIERAKTEYSAVVAAMSGPFVQRGLPAVTDKWTRAAQAIRHGVDLVLEVPQGFVLQSADRYAAGAIQVLAAIPAVCAIAFGVEETALREAPFSENATFEKDLVRRLKQGLSYRRAFSLASGRNWLPNQILAKQYEKALKEQNLSWEILKVARPSTSPTATQLRHALRSLREESIAAKTDANSDQLLQHPALKDLADPAIVLSHPLGGSVEKLFSYVQARTILDPLDFSRSPHYEAGMEYRLEAALQQADSLEDAINAASNKRQSKSRYRRMLLTTLLGIQKTDIAPLSYVRPLAFNRTGAALLRDVILPIYQKTPGRLRPGAYDPLFLTDQKAQRLYEWLYDLENLDLTQSFYHKR